VPAVCVYCASSDHIDPRYLELAAAVGRALVAAGLDLVSGGGSVGMMGAVAHAVREAGGHTTGVIPRALADREVADLAADVLVVTENMRERKGVMDNRADAFLALPGGIGTLEELLEVWTSRALGMHAKPVVVLDPYGDLAPLRALVDQLADAAFVPPEARDAVAWTTSVEEAVHTLTAAG
jgi:uncharacterized protein (TIGR00730 family)